MPLQGQSTGPPEVQVWHLGGYSLEEQMAVGEQRQARKTLEGMRPLSLLALRI